MPPLPRPPGPRGLAYAPISLGIRLARANPLFNIGHPGQIFRRRCISPERIENLKRRTGTIFGFNGKQTIDQKPNSFGRIRRNPAQRHRRSRQPRGQNLIKTASFVRGRAGENFIQQNPNRIEIGCRRDAFTSNLLGRQIFRRPHQVSLLIHIGTEKASGR